MSTANYINKLFEDGYSYINIRRNLNDTPVGGPLVVNYVARVRMGGDCPAVSVTHATDPMKALKMAVRRLEGLD